MEGDARSPGVQVLNRLKNRYTAPQQIDPAITLAAMRAPGRDTGRWKVKQGAEIIGYVSDVKVGGIESTNCHARAAEQRDTHIERVLDPMAVPLPSASSWRSHPAAGQSWLLKGWTTGQRGRCATGCSDAGSRLEAGCCSTWNTRMRPRTRLRVASAIGERLFGKFTRSHPSRSVQRPAR
jgi:hypothetical protein